MTDTQALRVVLYCCRTTAWRLSDPFGTASDEDFAEALSAKRES